MPPVPCKFFLQGSCRFGSKCKFYHPPQGSGIASSNRFSAFQSPDNTNSRNNGYNQGGGRGGGGAQPDVPFSLDKAQIITDLSTERPQWILSAYGPGRNAPAQMFGGPVREQSFEEMHFLHRMGELAHNYEPAVAEAQKLFQASEQQIQTVLNDVDGAIKFIIDALNDSPNRLDVVSGKAVPVSGSQPNPFSQASGAQSTNPNTFSTPSAPAFGAPPPAGPPASGLFGQPSGLGAKPSPFGAPVFGAPSQPAPGSAFGQPSQLNGGAFGQPSQPARGGGAFGQPSALGPSQNPFGAPSSGGPAFGTTSIAAPAPFSAFSSNANSFSQAAPATTNPFGAPSQPATSTPFGAPSQPAQSNPFGAPSGQAPNPFGGAAAAPFGAPSPAPNNPFGGDIQAQPANPNPFGGTPTPAQNPFGPAQPAASSAPNPFSNPQPNPPVLNSFGNPGTNNSTANPFGSTPSGPAQPAVNGNTASAGANGTIVHPPLSSYSTKDQNGSLSTFKGNRVTYREGVPGIQNMGRPWTKIWFPEGAPPFYKDTQMDESAYDDSTKAAYLQMRQTGSFPGGVMPLIPPLREWCLWDF